MNRTSRSFSLAALIAAVVLSAAVPAFAQRLSTRETRDIVRSLNSKVDDLQYYVNYQLSSTSADPDSAADARDALQDLKRSIQDFEDVFNQKRENRDDVGRIVEAGIGVRRVLQTGATQKADADWNSIRSLINRLGNGYGLVPDWNGTGASPHDRPSPFPARSTTMPGGLSGSYLLDTTRSESVADIISGMGVSSNDRADLESKLEAPEQISINVRGQQVTLATSKGPALTFSADGREKTETDSGGRTVRVRATLRGNALTISSLGGESDYTVTFTAEDSGRSLKVTRRITTAYLRETVFADSFYSRTGDDTAQLGIENGDPDNGGYSSSDPQDGINSGTSAPSSATMPRIGEFIVRDGEIITAILDHDVNTKVSQNNDRFRLIVRSPDEFRGAVIEGYLTGVGRSGKVSGRSNVTFNFQRITLRDGKSYDFSGNMTALQDLNGKDVRIDSEGTAKGDSQTKETVKRGGIGAGIGALIGAIAGGGKGAAIGAIIGGGAGAGSVVVQGRDDLRLEKGSTMTITASSPNR